MLGFFRKLFGRQKTSPGAEAPRVAHPEQQAAKTQALEASTVFRPYVPRQMPALLRTPEQLAEPPRRMPDLRERNGKEYSTIGLIYRDAQGACTERIVTVTAIVSDETRRDIFGYCHLRRDFRQFRADRIEGFFDPETGETFTVAHLKVHAGPITLPCGNDEQLSVVPKTLIEVFERHAHHLEAIGWVVRFNSPAGGDELLCHRIGKRGAPLKRPTIEFRYEPLAIEQRAEPDGTVATYFTGFRDRPWVLRAEGRTTRTWSQLAPALAAFLEAAGL